MSIKVGLVGPNGSGKSTICSWFKTHGFSCISLSDFVRETVAKKGKVGDRTTLIHTANELKAEHGADYLARKALELAPDSSSVVYDSIRHPDEVCYLKQHGVIILGVTAPVEIRYSRVFSRANDTDHVSLETFREHDQLERSGKSSGQSIEACLRLCETIFQNDETEDILLSKLKAYFNTHYAKEAHLSCHD